MSNKTASGQHGRGRRSAPTFPAWAWLAAVAILLNCAPSEATRPAQTSAPAGGEAGAGLPPPFATPSVTKRSRIIPRPEGAELKVPAGFQVSVFAEGLEQPRWMALAPNGDLFVAESRAGRITALRDGDGDGKPETSSAFAERQNAPFGMAFYENYLYVGNTDSIVRFRYRPGQLKAEGDPERIADLPSGSVQPGRGGGHWTRNILFSPDGKKMYVAVGSATNNSPEQDTRRAAVNEYNPDGTGHRVFASGLRNPVGIAFFPGSNTLWVTVNERDRMGDDLVPDYLTSVTENGFYGWPYSYIGQHYDPDHVGKRPDLVEKAIVPDVLLPAHGAALGLAFYTGSQFPSHYRHNAFVALHGSWNRSRFAGYQVVRVPFQNGRPSGKPEIFLSGWIASDEESTVWGRPVGLLVWRDGSLLVADDGGNRIWKVNYSNEEAR